MWKASYKSDRKLIDKACLVVTCLLMIVSAIGCSIPGQKDLHIETGSIGTQFRTDQMERIFSGLGYQQEMLRSPVTGVVDERVDDGPWIILMFNAKESPAVRSKVWVNRDTGLIKLYFREEGSGGFSSDALDLYRDLKNRLEKEFGADQVREL